jgi:hypothetical protein
LGFKREDIRDLSPLSLKKLNDTLRFLWVKQNGNITFGDVDDTFKRLINSKTSASDLSDALANVLTTGNFSTTITKNYIASMGLAVGSEILMGTNAKISWANVTNQPTIPTTAAQVGALPTNWKGTTYIDANGVYTGSLIADQIKGGTIQGVIVKSVNGTNSLEINGSKLTSRVNGKKAIEMDGYYHKFHNYWDTNPDSAPTGFLAPIKNTNSGRYGLRVATCDEMLQFGKYVASDSGGANVFLQAKYPSDYSNPELIMWGSSLDMFVPLAYLYGSLNVYTGSGQYNLYLSENELSSITGTRLWLNYRGCYEVMIGGGGSNGNYGNLYCKDFRAYGSKNSVVKTENFGDIALSAYETPDTLFGDVGEGTLENGECIIYLDEQIKACMNTDISYQVFLSKYGRGDVWVEERNSDYFIVKGDYDISFGWEIKAKRRGYEATRFENISLEPENKEFSSDETSYVDSLLSENTNQEVLI